MPYYLDLDFDFNFFRLFSRFVILYSLINAHFYYVVIYVTSLTYYLQLEVNLYLVSFILVFIVIVLIIDYLGYCYT